MLVTLKKQRRSLKRLWQHHACQENNGALIPLEAYSSFHRRFTWSGVGTDLCLFGQLRGGMGIGIERDGHDHS